MNLDIIQDIRYRLQKRFRKINTASHHRYKYVFQQFVTFVQDDPLLSDTLASLIAAVPTAKADAKRIIDGEELQGTTEIEEAALGYEVMQLCSNDSDVDLIRTIAYRYGQGSTFEEQDAFFTETFVEPLYEYLDEALDKNKMLLAMLLRYKRRTEWFHRDLLLKAWSDDPSRGEKKLADNLYEYLYDQGIDFFIEPASASGEIDLISAQTGEERLLVDAKVFNPDKGKSQTYIASGVHQIYTYAQDYGEPVAFLVIFRTSSHELRFDTPSIASGVPYVISNGKHIFLIQIDLHDHEVSASKRGPLKQIVISVDDLVRSSATPSIDSQSCF